MRLSGLLPFVILALPSLPLAAPAAEPPAAEPRRVVAQALPAASTGITVSSRISRIVHADTVVFAAYVQTMANADPTANADAIVAALKKDGIQDAAWSAGSLQVRSGTAVMISGSAPVTTEEAIKKVFLDASLAAGTAIAQNIQISLQLRNCAAAQDALRKSAIEDARHQAETIASDLGVKLGPVTNVNAAALGQSACPHDNAVGFGGPANNAFGAGQWNPDGTLTVTGSVTVTFAIAK
jgi:uncharacterized protein YggE